MNTSRKTTVHLVGVLVTAAALFAGCSGSGDDLPRQEVGGIVKVDGQPLARGTIQFIPKGGDAAVGGGSPVVEGRFHIPTESGLTPGTYAVAVYASVGNPTPPAKGRVVEKKGLARELIPAKYNARTELTAEIKKGETANLTFDLKSS